MSQRLLPPKTITEPASRSNTRAWLVTVMLVFLAIVNWADKAVLGLVAVPLMEDLGIGPGQYGILSSSIYFLFSLSAVGAGFIANKRSSKWLLAGMVVIWSVCQFSIWLVPTFAMILISRIILGFGEGPSAGLSYLAVSKWFRNEERNLPLALQNVGAFAGIAVAAPVVTYVATKWSWQWAFFVVGAIGVIWLGLWLFIGKEGPYSGSSEDEKIEDLPSPLDGDMKVPYAKLLLSRSYIGVCCLGLAAYCAMSVTSSWIPTYLQKAHNYPPMSAANITVAISVSAIFLVVGAALLTSRLMKRGVTTRIARGAVAAISTLVSGLLIVLMTNTTEGFLQTVLLCVGFGLGLINFTAGATMISEFVPVLQRGAALGLYVAIITTAGIFAPAIFGWIVSAYGDSILGYETAIRAVGIALIVGGIAGLYLVDPGREAKRVLSIAGYEATDISTQ